MTREQRLVGGDNRRAGGKRGLDRRFGRIAVAAKSFDEYVDRGIGRQRRPDRRPSGFSRRSIPRFLLRERALTATTSIGTATARGEFVALLLQESNDSRADGSESGNTDFQRLGHKTSPTGM